MKRNLILLSFILLTISLLLSSCATTTLTSVWSDEEYKGHRIKKILVIGVSQKPAIRRFFEDEFVKQFRERGINAVSSYAIIPEDKMLEEAFVRSKVKEMNVDAVLITRLVDRKIIETYHPPKTTYPGPHAIYPPHYFAPGHYPPAYYHSWYGYYYDCYQCITTPGYKVQDEILNLETSLYDSVSDKLIWSALSDTFAGTLDGGFDEGLIRSFIKVIMKRLSGDAIIQ